MTNYKHIIFDLDGTIIESSSGILEGFALALQEHNIKPKTTIDSSLIGPPLRQTVSRLVGSSNDSLIDLVVDSFKKHYDSSGYKSTQLFDEVFNVLSTLSESDSRIYIATNKRINPTIKILNHLKIDSFFDAIYALDSFSPALNSKSHMLMEIISQNKIDPSNAIYIGDRVEDGHAADDNNLTFALALWGFAGEINKAELNKNWQLLNSPREMI